MGVVCIAPYNQDFYHKVGDTTIRVQRTQLPLILCWAITIHKSQGMSLEEVIWVLDDLDSIGLCYVACSRATSFHNFHVVKGPKKRILTLDDLNETSRSKNSERAKILKELQFISRTSNIPDSPKADCLVRSFRSSLLSPIIAPPSPSHI